MCEDVRLEVCRLCKFLVASIKGADVGPVARVDSNVGAKVKIKAEPLAAAFKSTLEGFLPGMD